MKKKLIFFIILSSFPMVSCKKYLEVDPSNVVTLTTYDDVKALMGSYIRSFTTTGDNLQGVSIPYRTYENHLFFALYADELDTDYFLNHAFARNYSDLYKESLNWTNRTFPGTIWEDYFGAIGFLNTITDALDEVKGGTDAQRDIVRCEAKVLRAWYLFKLLQYFSPYSRDDLGIPFSFESKRIGEYDRKRKTQAQVYSTIISELEEVLECPTQPRKSYNIWYDKSIANAILAQVYHFKGGSAAGVPGDYRNAVAYARAAMEGRSIMSLTEYEPFPTMPGNTFGVYKDKPQSLLVSVTYNMWGMYAGLSVPAVGTPYNPQFAREDVYALYGVDDIRRDKFFVMRTNDMKEGAQSPAIRKYQAATFTAGGSPDGGSRGILVFNFFLVADLHLIVAESYARLNERTDAVQWLENFQRERYEGYTSFTGSDVLGTVLLERRKEFFLEGDHRWCDLIRQNEGWTRKSDGSDANVTTNRIEEGDFRFCLPIPLQQETAHNKIEQNPGWGM